ncbi:hypothetical protein D6D06_05291 [Aureobasidium pullulans]|nr:hypothetical protein D6D06_05291 [Aureobasidium pullulans]
MAEQQTQPASLTPIFGSPVLNLVERIEEHAYYFLKELDFWLDRTQHPSTLEYQDILSLHPASLEQDIHDSAYMLSIEIELQEEIARMRASAYAQLDRIASAEKPVIVHGSTPDGNPGASLRPLPRPLPPSSPPPAERPRSSVESYRSLNELVTTRLNRFLIAEDEYPKRYNIWQQHNLEVDTLKDAMLDDTVAAECQRKLPAALKLEAESRRKFVDSARACFHFIKELEYSQNRSFELDEESLEGVRVNKELVQDLWSSFAEATSTPSWLLSMYQYI